MIDFVGDVHGFDDRVERLVAGSRHDLVFVGDLIDRGPDSAAVVRRVRALCEAGRARCIMGNHEYALVRGLGVPERGIPAVPMMYQSWLMFYGGTETCASYGCSGSPEELREALGDDLLWLADLPWMLEGAEGRRRCIAVHAGLDHRPLIPQLRELEDPARWWEFSAQLPPPLYSKERIDSLPVDLPAEVCVVSGHTPLPSPIVTPSRVVCDTSGGMADRPLTMVTWPTGEITQVR